MKFCKNLQRVVQISDPEWSPFWPNYKMLKKLIKELPSLVPSDEYKNSICPSEPVHEPVAVVSNEDSSEAPTSLSRQEEESSALKQQHGDRTTENDHDADDQASVSLHDTTSSASQPQRAEALTKNPAEVAFFKMLHAEFKKASYFFERATGEFAIREERVREGMEIMKQPNSFMVNERWALMAKSIYRLYRDLLLLETFAIMAYCSFSKILKKHDKMTGYCTRCAFMSNVVNKANFTNYPVVMAMIGRCERLYEDVSDRLLKEGNGSLYEDERLFICMIHRLNEQVLSSDKDLVSDERIDAVKRPLARSIPSSENESRATLALRSIVEDNDMSKNPTKVADTAQSNNGGVDDDDSDDNSVPNKRGTSPHRGTDSPAKKLRTS